MDNAKGLLGSTLVSDAITTVFLQSCVSKENALQEEK